MCNVEEGWERCILKQWCKCEGTRGWFLWGRRGREKSTHLHGGSSQQGRTEPSGPENSWCHSCHDLGKTWARKDLGSIWEKGLSGLGGISFCSLFSFCSFARQACYIRFHLSAGVGTPSTSHISKHVRMACWLTSLGLAQNTARWEKRWSQDRVSVV